MSLLMLLGGQSGLPVNLATPGMKVCWLTATGTFSFLLGHQNPYLPNTKRLYQLSEAMLVVSALYWVRDRLRFQGMTFWPQNSGFLSFLRADDSGFTGCLFWTETTTTLRLSLILIVFDGQKTCLLVPPIYKGIGCFLQGGSSLVSHMPNEEIINSKAQDC